MSKGSRIVTFRIKEDLYLKALAKIESRNRNTKEEEWKFTHFVIACIADKLKHAERSKKKTRNKKPKKTEVPQTAQSDQTSNFIESRYID